MFYSSDFCLSAGGFFFLCVCINVVVPFHFYIYTCVTGVEHMMDSTKKNKGLTFLSTSALLLTSHHVRHKPKKSTLLSTRSRVTMYEQNSTNDLHDVLMVYWVTGYCRFSVLQPQDYSICKLSIQLWDTWRMHRCACDCKHLFQRKWTCRMSLGKIHVSQFI